MFENCMNMYRHGHSPKNQPSLISALMLNIKSMASQKMVPSTSVPAGAGGVNAGAGDLGFSRYIHETTSHQLIKLNHNDEKSLLPSHYTVMVGPWGFPKIITILHYTDRIQYLPQIQTTQAFSHCSNYTPSNFETQISTVQPLPESHQRRLWTSPQLRMEVIDSSSKGVKATKRRFG